MRKRISVVLAFSMIMSCLSTAVVRADANEEAKAVGAGATSVYEQRFLDLWGELHDSTNGYFSPEGVPYHAIETLMVEAPDYGHATTSEAASYYIWLEAMYGKFTKDWTKYTKAWDTVEKYYIPSSMDQPGLSKYTSNKPATYAGEWELPSQYPSQLETNVPSGSDPIHSELYSAYGTYDIYGMHWILDCDNWYGYGNRGDGTSKPSYFNTFQRGEQESVWETVPHPSWEALKWGGTYGFQDLFIKESQPPAKQWRYTNAPDADARAVQAAYWAKEWAKESGADVKKYTEKAVKMGDYLRYALFDKYFKKMGAQDKNAGGSGYDACHYLVSWYYAWGGGLQGDWSWKMGCSHTHQGYQNPVAAWALSNDPDMKPRSTNGASDWKKSLDRQIEYYTWLQSEEGAIAGGATNSYKGRYEKYPAGTPTFYGMAYDWQPVWHDPPSNDWFGYQAWPLQRVAEYYYLTGDKKAEAVLSKWVKWAISGTKLNADGTFQIISNMDWSGQPETWNGYSSFKGNPNLHCKIRNYSQDLGVAGSFANTLLWYSAGTKKWSTFDDEPRWVAKELLDRMWKNFRDDKGIAAPEARGDYKKFFTEEAFIPAGWTGKMANGDVIKSGVKFIDIRSKYKQDPGFKVLQDAMTAGKDPVYTYHRFWAQCDIALANGTYAILFPGGSEGANITGNVGVDLTSTASDVKAGFKVELVGTDKSAVTDTSGSFTLENVPAGTYSITISKKNYLTRTISNVVVGTSAVTLPAAATMWYGDITADGAINMADIMEDARAFNSVRGDGRYSPDLDPDLDGAINMTDIMIVAKHFNATSASYPGIF